ncbi:pyridoxal phosphate-dependent aminotransferase family protein [bacterium]|nr:pyridoxal phosphate-dependent aminotransferase family protein [bacterium]
MYRHFENTLEILKTNSHLREIRNIENKNEKYIWFNGKKLLNLSSNNYLGFADNKEITKAFLETVGSAYSLGSASARLLTGNLPIYNELENLLCNLFNKEKSLLFNSGYHANVGITSSIADKNDVIFSDKLNHASIIDGMKLSQSKFFRYQHNNMESLEKLLTRERKNYNNAFIITESIFSMDGDIANLKKIIELKEKYNCILVVDEAHAFGVFGKNGLGVCEQLEIIKNVDLIVGTFGKAIGSMGAFVVGNKTLIDYLTNKARSFIFSTALPPINIAFSKWIIENKLHSTFEKRQNMLKLSKDFGSDSHIIPVIIGTNTDTEIVCKRLFDAGYFTLPIRPPTVPEGTSRLRISLTTEIQKDDLKNIQEIISSLQF